MCYLQDARHRQEVVRCTAIAVRVLTEDLLESARVFGRMHHLTWDYDPAVLMIGPELLRQPAFEQLYPSTILRDVYGAMNGREELYCQIGDLMDLLALQQIPITSEDQCRVAKDIEEFVGLRWFRQSLILASRVTLERFPDNPLWMAPDGSIQGAQHPRFQRLHYCEWEELNERVCAPVKRGRCMGSGGRFRDAQDFREAVIRDLRALRQRGRDETQLELARLWYQTDADPTAEVDSLVASIKRYCRRYRYIWEALVAQARQ